jgi:glutaredoxin-like YruB-family protein
MRGEILTHEIKVYGTSNCPWCAKAKQLLDENNITYEDIDISKDRVAFERIVNETGWMTVPVIDIDGELAAGFSEKWIRQKLGLD